MESFSSHLIEEADQWELGIRNLASGEFEPEYFECVADYAARLRKIARKVTPENIELIRETYQVTHELACNSIWHLQRSIHSKQRPKRPISGKHEHAYELLWWFVFDYPDPVTKQNIGSLLEKFENDECLAINPDNPADPDYTAELPARRETIKTNWLGKIQFEVSVARSFLDKTEDLELAIANARKMFDAEKRSAFLQKRKAIE